MSKKSIYKYKHDEETGFMHYVVFNGEIAVLSKKDSLKVEYVEQTGTLAVTADLKSEEYEDVKAKVVKDKAYIQDLYNTMNELGNSYFRDGIEGLCAIVFEK